MGSPSLLLDLTGRKKSTRVSRRATELSRWPGGRALYDPGAGESRSGLGIACRFYYAGDAP
ncbi:hypothetical protein [Streptomyces collinus]|uniref:hypothetical protein n=1 Tax=Streptomyces collinus TaxID=42684 RepID=UPI00332AB276